MGCVLVEERRLPVLQPVINALATGVAPRIHFNNDTDRQKRRVLAAIAEMHLQTFAVVCDKRHGANEFHARAACVAEIVRQLQRRAVGRLVLESRQDDRDDVRTITRARAKEPSLLFEHRTARHERALWLADAVSWAVGAGSPWNEALAGSLIDVIEIDPE
jgi:hypothetical protein